MKRFLLLVLLGLSIFSNQAQATHILGADISYKYVSTGASGDIYNVTVIIYRNCQTPAHVNDFATYTPVVHVFDTVLGKFPPAGVNLLEYSLPIIADSTKDISPYCDSIMAYGTDCTNPASTYVGIYRYLYNINITIPHKSTGWEIAFVSNLVSCSSGDEAGKAKGANVKLDGHENAVAIAMLNNMNGHNSSPLFNLQKSSTYFPINTPSTFIEEAVDPDHDSLAYNLEVIYTRNDDTGNCYSAFAIQDFNTAGGYSLAHPIDVAPGTYNFNTANGNISFTPSLVNNYSIATRTTEYRNGVVVGSLYRELIFIVLSSGGPILQATLDTTKIAGATVTGSDTLYACPGNIVSFNAPIKDALGHVIKVSFTDIIGGSTVAVNNNNTNAPELLFNWNTTGVPYGVYTVTPYFTINACPLPQSSSHTYTIIIGDAGDITQKILSETNCIRKAAMEFIVDNGNLAYNINLVQGADTIKRYNEPAGTGTVGDSLAVGNYLAILHTQNLPCTSYINFQVADSGPYPYKPIPGADTALYCRNYKDSALVAHLDSNAAYLKWYDAANNSIPDAYVPSTATAGTFLFTVSQVYKTCESARDTMVVVVDPNVCDYDVDIHNAMTPNGDGKNDVWAIDNLKFYPDVHVEVFDKLGDKVFEQSHYSAPWWDGGKVPSGVYYYVVDLGKPNVQTGKQKYTGYILIKR